MNNIESWFNSIDEKWNKLSDILSTIDTTKEHITWIISQETQDMFWVNIQEAHKKSKAMLADMKEFLNENDLPHEWKLFVATNNAIKVEMLYNQLDTFFQQPISVADSDEEYKMVA